ncbi:Rossmann-fold NAD(P)-binding domain-containing protein [Mucilaginibacter xinganensis]|uniref:Nucleoside-diphosphate sugar epimerase n=1 Tax=Mucilaginibacter xinganensis TaxID=1234841 RepID=A0A223NRI8_9SPHI|nr:NAD(P)H-binding protein [Mucilaginibacter xinganensis]ASU32268.1 nucleoside-diphosphate sugar epimerase [Mucilaginibacter xinganensis]
MLKKAIIAGASGLVGNELLHILLTNPGYDEVLVLVRRELPLKHGKLKQLIVDFDKISDYQAEITGEAFFCCLGSTKKKTPNLADYRKVDHDYPLQLAQIALANGIGQYHLVSAMGAEVKSGNFYMRLKGETEADIINTGLPGLYIYRPAMLTGERTEDRPLERFLTPIMKVIDLFLIGNLKKYRSIAAKTVAIVMYKQSLKNKAGTFIYASDKIKEL